MLQRPELNEDGKILLKVADIIDEKGWCQLRSINEDGNVCIVGAFWCLRHDAIIERPYAVLSHVIGDIPRWNDVPGRTKEEVTSKIREVAYSCALENISST